MDGQPTWTDFDEAGDYVVPNVLSPRDLVFRPDNMDETVPDTTFESQECLALVTTWRWWDSNLLPLALECDALPLSH